MNNNDNNKSNKKGKIIIRYTLAASAIFTLSVITLALVESQTAAAATGTTTTIASSSNSAVTGKITFLPWYEGSGVITFLQYYANGNSGGITLLPQTQPMSGLSGV
jgi:hypothetical protein